MTQAHHGRRARYEQAEAGHVRALMPNAIALRLRCTDCHGSLTLQMKDWHTVPPGVERDNVMVTQAVTCPHCQRFHELSLPGTIKRVAKGYV